MVGHTSADLLMGRVALAYAIKVSSCIGFINLHAATTGGMVVLWTGETFILYYTNKLLIA